MCNALSIHLRKLEAFIKGNRGVALKPSLHIAYRGWVRLIKYDSANAVSDFNRLPNLTPSFMNAPLSKISVLYEKPAILGKRRA